MNPAEQQAMLRSPSALATCNDSEVLALAKELQKQLLREVAKGASPAADDLLLQAAGLIERMSLSVKALELRTNADPVDWEVQVQFTGPDMTASNQWSGWRRFEAGPQVNDYLRRALLNPDSVRLRPVET